MCKNVFKIIKKHIFYIFLLLVLLITMSYFKVPCFFRFFTGFPCPSCGMTRAFFSLIKLNFRDSFYYHPLLIPALITAFIAIHVDVTKFNFNKKFFNIYFWTFIIIFFAVYIFRIITNSIP